MNRFRRSFHGQIEIGLTVDITGKENQPAKERLGDDGLNINNSTLETSPAPFLQAFAGTLSELAACEQMCPACRNLIRLVCRADAKDPLCLFFYGGDRDDSDIPSRVGEKDSGFSRA